MSGQKVIAGLKEAIAVEAERPEDWPPPAFDEGVDYTITLLAGVLGISTNDFSWDAATEEHAGDVSAVIGNALTARFGDDWADTPKIPEHQ